jgi:photosystem II S4 domain protein
MFAFVLTPVVFPRSVGFPAAQFLGLKRLLNCPPCVRRCELSPVAPRRRGYAISATGKSTRDAALKTTDALGVPRETAMRVFEAAERVVREWASTTTEFLTPPEVEALSSSLKGMADLFVDSWGGYSSAERKVLVLARAEVLECAVQTDELARNDLACLYIKGNFLFDVASHRDFLGAILGSGISRQKVGDIITLGDRGCQVVASADVVDFLQATLTAVRSVPVQVERIGWEQLDARPPSIKEMSIVEASMRLDAVASAGFSVSRSKLNGMVKSGDCQVNYKQVSSPSKTLKEADIVSVRGKGKLKIGETTVTSKGRYRIQLTRFV